MSPNPESTAPISEQTIGNAPSGVSRRHFVGFVLAGTTLIVAGRYVVDPDHAAAAEGVPDATGVRNGLSPEKYRAAGGATPILSNDLVADDYDFMDVMRDTTRAVTPLLTLEVKPDGRVQFDMPRVEVGQGVEGVLLKITAHRLP
jgi:isoquinoline 1-oxidoreductase beta subunit